MAMRAEARTTGRFAGRQSARPSQAPGTQQARPTAPGAAGRLSRPSQAVRNNKSAKRNSQRTSQNASDDSNAEYPQHVPHKKRKKKSRSNFRRRPPTILRTQDVRATTMSSIITASSFLGICLLVAGTWRFGQSWLLMRQLFAKDAEMDIGPAITYIYDWLRHQVYSVLIGFAAALVALVGCFYIGAGAVWRGSSLSAVGNGLLLNIALKFRGFIISKRCYHKQDEHKEVRMTSWGLAQVWNIRKECGLQASGNKLCMAAAVLLSVSIVATGVYLWWNLSKRRAAMKMASDDHPDVVLKGARANREPAVLARAMERLNEGKYILPVYAGGAGPPANRDLENFGGSAASQPLLDARARASGDSDGAEIASFGHRASGASSAVAANPARLTNMSPRAGNRLTGMSPRAGNGLLPPNRESAGASSAAGMSFAQKKTSMFQQFLGRLTTQRSQLGPDTRRQQGTVGYAYGHTATAAEAARAVVGADNLENDMQLLGGPVPTEVMAAGLSGPDTEGIIELTPFQVQVRRFRVFAGFGSAFLLLTLPAVAQIIDVFFVVVRSPKAYSYTNASHSKLAKAQMAMSFGEHIGVVFLLTVTGMIVAVAASMKLSRATACFAYTVCQSALALASYHTLECVFKTPGNGANAANPAQFILPALLMMLLPTCLAFAFAYKHCVLLGLLNVDELEDEVLWDDDHWRFFGFEKRLVYDMPEVERDEYEKMWTPIVGMSVAGEAGGTLHGALPCCLVAEFNICLLCFASIKPPDISTTYPTLTTLFSVPRHPAWRPRHRSSGGVGGASAGSQRANWSNAV